MIAGGSVEHSVLSRNVRVGEGALIFNCLLFDHVRVGEGAMLRNCIVDKHDLIPAGHGNLKPIAIAESASSNAVSPE